MITLENGLPQGPNGLVVPNGSISFSLNVDATVIAAPYGFVSAAIPIVFQFDSTGKLIQPAQLYSNLELNPQNGIGLGTYYLVTFYDQNGARINAVPLWWQFPEAANSTVDIGEVTPYATVGGNVDLLSNEFRTSTAFPDNARRYFFEYWCYVGVGSLDQYRRYCHLISACVFRYQWVNRRRATSCEFRSHDIFGSYHRAG